MLMSNKTYHLYGENYLLFDEETGRIAVTYDNKTIDYCFLMSIEAFYGLTEERFQMFGNDYCLIQQKGGEGAGCVSARSFQGIDPEQLAEAIKIGFNGVSRWGFGRYELKELDIQNWHVIFNLHDSVFEYHGNNNQYTRFVEEPHYLIGFYKGFFSVLFGKKMRCTCSRVINSGKAHYKFELNPAFEECDDILPHDSIIKKDTARTPNNNHPPQLNL